MTPSESKSLRAVLEPLPNDLRWVIARLPFDAAKAWPELRGKRVQGEIEGFAFRTSLLSFAGEGYFLLVNKKMQLGAKVCVGAAVRITLAPDLEERVVIVPPELATLLKQDRQLSAGSTGWARDFDAPWASG